VSGELQARNVGKAYRRWGSEWLRALSWFGLPVKPAEEHWVLRHIDFKVGPGESVGIVGQNGAGKSTLLKLITGTTRPSEGSVASQGRVAAILELGMGFNADLTGRENAFHTAGLMGHEHAEIERLMPAIESFAEIGEYFDQPVRTYSSGMQMRVAFSVATAVRPDLLIVDEALAVGDAYFIHKSFQRIREYREAGTTLLIVSHDATAIQSLCDRAILIERGRVLLDGAPQEIFDYYNALIAEKENSTIDVERREKFVATQSGTGEAVFESVRLLDASGADIEYLSVGVPVTLRVTARAHHDLGGLVFGYMLRDRLGQAVFGTNTHYTGQELADVRAGDLIEFDASFRADLGPGTYSVSLALHSQETHLVNNYQWKDLALIFTVANTDKIKFSGVAYLPPQIGIKRFNSDGSQRARASAESV
jgi:lipopolysaccharide transport system ATP-binding protein